MIKRNIAPLLVLGGLLCASHVVCAETVFVFNPEARVENIAQVKAALEKFFRSKKISADVYIFANPVDFEHSIDRLQPDVAIVASYYYSSMKSVYNWDIVLSGHNEGVEEFRKVLVTHKTIKDPLELNNKTLATVSLGSASLPYIDAQLPQGLSTEMLRVVAVSKDIDAIMALGFKQVEAAIVTQASFDKLQKINPKVTENMHILQELNPIQYPKLVAFPNAKRVEQFAAGLQELSSKGAMKTILRFFGLTGFNPES